MRITVVAHGSRGDVQPPMVLAHRLVERGHDVCFFGPSDFADAARALGCRVVAGPVDVRAEISVASLRESLLRGRTLGFFTEAFEREALRVQQTMRAVLEACAGAELIVAPATMEDLCISIAEAHGQRVAFAFPMPVWSNTTYPSFLFSEWPVPAFLNGFSYTLMELGARRVTPIINRARAELGLRTLSRRPTLGFRGLRPPAFYWVPPEVLPPPAGFGRNHVFCGYWEVLPAVRAAFGERTPPAAVDRFLAESEAVYVGFGSMPVLLPSTVDAVRGAARSLGVRVLLSAGWSSLATIDDDVILGVESIDHDWAFRRCAAAVHHGGAGTTGAAIRAGTPSVVAAVFADQPFWGRRVRELGVGDTLRFQAIDERRLRVALARALAPATRARARSLARELSARPDGVEMVCRIIEQRGATFPIPPRQ